MSDGFVINGNVLTTFSQKQETVVIPERVSVVGDSAFKACSSIVKVVLPNTITKIENNAFKGCRRLKEINFPPSLTEIGDFAFHRCHCLKQVTLPNGTHTLGQGAFLFCDTLESAAIPGVHRLGRQAFLNDIKLNKIVVSDSLLPESICDVFTGCIDLSSIEIANQIFYSIENPVNFLASKEQKHPIANAIVKDILRMMDVEGTTLKRFRINVKDLQIIEGIETISKSCFSYKYGIQTLRLPASLSTISKKAFQNCISLEEIEFANDNVKIESDAFYNCTALKRIRLSDSTTYDIAGILHINDMPLPPLVSTIHKQVLSNFFFSGTTLIRYRGREQRVTVPSGIKIIGENAFAGNDAIGRISLPETVETIHDGAFSDCVTLQTIDLPKNLSHIGPSAFENCIKLLRIELPRAITVVERSTFNRCRKLSKVTLGPLISKIDDLAFYSCRSLERIEFPNRLKHLGDLTFYKCTSLKRIELPNSLETVGNNAFTRSGIESAQYLCSNAMVGSDVFSECVRLKEIFIEDDVGHISNKFAYRCSSLTTVRFPLSVSSIGKGAFDGTPFLKKQKQSPINNKILLWGGDFSGDIRLSEGITTIAGGAFYGNTRITSISFPDSLQHIGPRSFCGCKNLKTVALPLSIDIIEEGCFAYCSSLHSINTEHVQSVDDRAFYGCSALNTINLQNIHSVGDNAFAHCNTLEHIDISLSDVFIQADAFSHTTYLEKVKNNATLAIVGNTLVDGSLCRGHIQIPDGVTFISPMAFAGNHHITHIILPPTLRKIGDFAFSGCRGLRQITSHGELERIGTRSFEKCPSLKQFQAAVTFVEAGAFSFCQVLEEVILKDTLNIGSGAFFECKNLSICQTPHLQTVGKGAFEGCVSLSHFDMEPIEHIFPYAFSGCTGLTHIEFGQNTQIHAHAFENCSGIEALSFSNKNPSFSCYAFSGCTRIETVSILDTIQRIDGYDSLFDDRINDIAKRVYQSALTCFEIDEQRTIFKYRNTGDRISIPNGIARIEENVFKDALNLTQIDMPSSVTQIGGRAFAGTKWLENRRSASVGFIVINGVLIDGSTCSGDISIPETVHTVAGWAFADNDAVSSIRFSPNHTHIEPHAFRNCINLNHIFTLDGLVFSICKLDDLDHIDHPAFIQRIFRDCYNCFKTDDQHNLIECTGNIRDLVLLDGIVSIKEKVFKQSNLLTTITFPDTLTTLEKGAFEQCKWLSSVKNTKYVKRIESSAFSGCHQLTIISPFKALESIGIRAFENCTSLKAISIPEGITEIPDKAFYRCTDLTTLEIPNSVRRIGKEAFAFCYNLKTITLPDSLCTIDSRAFAWCKSLSLNADLSRIEIKKDAFSFTR